MTYQDKYNIAKEAGYSDQEIMEYIGSKDDAFEGKMMQAKEAGYTPKEIISYFNTSPKEKEGEHEPLKKKSSNPFATPNITPEQYKNMSMTEKMEYAENLEKEQRYEHSKAFTKNLASGASFGATENIEALRPEEGEDPVASFEGQLMGSMLPIGMISKGVGLGLKGAHAAASQGPKILQYLTRFAQGFGTGALYESGKQGVNAASGKEVDVGQIPVTGALFGTGEALIQAFGDVGRKFLGLSPKAQAQILEEGIIPKDLPKSQYETAEEMLKLVNEKKKNNFIDNFPPGSGPPPPPPGGGAPPPGGSPSGLGNRVSPKGEDLGLRPASQKANPDLADEVGNLFSKDRFYNTTEGGKAFRKEITDIDQNVYRGVNELYKKSRELNGAFDEIHPNLVGKLENRIKELSDIPEPSDVQKRLLRTSENVLKKIAEFKPIKDEGGKVVGKAISGYKPINNQVLIDQVQSLRQIIDYDFAHGNTKNIFRPLINELQDAALNAAESSGTPEAAQAITDAKNAYRMWVEAFDNDYVRPFRDSSNQDYSKLFKSALDFDESNMLRKILNTTPRGQELINASTREIVEKNLGKYFENPRAVNPKEFDKAIRELEAVITPEQATEVKALFRDHAKRFEFKGKKTPAKQLSNEEVIAGKYTGKEPEDIQRLMNSRSGIKQLREDFKGSDQKKDLFEKLSKQKMRSIMREGNIEKDFTGDDLYKFLNKESNYEIFSEILGEKETEAMRQSAKEIGKAQVKSEVRKQNISKVTNKVVAFKTIEMLLGIL